MTHVDGVSERAGRRWFFFRIRGRSDRVTTAGEQLDAQGVHIPLVADMHFNRKAAMIACEAYDKIRVNPGNFADGRKTFEEIDYDVWGRVRCYTRRVDGVRAGRVPDFAATCRDVASVASEIVASRRWRRVPPIRRRRDPTHTLEARRVDGVGSMA